MKGELERIAMIRERLERRRDDVPVGIGDDAAVLAPSDHAQVLSVDVAVEGVHFRPDLASYHDIGRRALVMAASDLAAMGARARASLLALVLPSHLEDADFADLLGGLGEGADETRAAVVGGNLSSGGELSITSTVVGELDGAPLTRSGAREGDGIYVTGVVGAAALGLALLERGQHERDDPSARACIARWKRPTAALMHGQRLVGHASAAIDLSDGLLSDLKHICDASGVGAEVHAECVPRVSGFDALAGELGLPPLALALTGGDDYELLFTAPASSLAKELATRIGHVAPAEHGIRVTEAGVPVDVEPTGYRHFER